MILKLLNWVLSLLPFNGDKLKIGALITLILEIKQQYPEFDYLAFLDVRLKALGLGFVAIGIIHKIMKRLVEKAEAEYGPKVGAAGSYMLALLCLLTGLQQPAQAETLRNCLTLMNQTGQTASTNGTLIAFPAYNQKGMAAVLTATNTAGSSPTLDVVVQNCRTGTYASASCKDWYTFVQCTTGTCFRPVDVNKDNVNWFGYFRAATTIGGTSTPTYTVKVELCYNN